MMLFYFQRLVEIFPFFLKGLWMTVAVSGISLVLATICGLLLGIVRASRNKPLVGLIGAYVAVIRGTPFVVQIFIISFILPEWGIQLEAFPAAILALTIQGEKGALGQLKYEEGLVGDGQPVANVLTVNGAVKVIEELAAEEGVRCFRGDEQDVIARLGAAAAWGGYDYVLDKSSSTIFLFYRDQYDLSIDVLEEMGIDTESVQSSSRN